LLELTSPVFVSGKGVPEKEMAMRESEEPIVVLIPGTT
jgi:hypothetical protein